MKKSLLIIVTAFMAIAPMMHGQGLGLPQSPSPYPSSASPDASGRKALYAQNNAPSAPTVPLGSPNIYGELNSQRPLKTGDTLDVQISKDLDLNVKVQVDKNGDVDIPYVGKIAVAGKTMTSAIETIQKKISEYFLSNRVDFPDAALPAIPVNPPERKKEPASPAIKPTTPAKAEPIVPAEKVIRATPVTPAPAPAPKNEILFTPSTPKSFDASPDSAKPTQLPPLPKPAIAETIPAPTPKNVEAPSTTPSIQPISEPKTFSPRRKSEKLDVEFLKGILSMDSEDAAEDKPAAPEPAPILPPLPPEPINNIAQLPPPPAPAPVPATTEKIRATEMLPLRAPAPEPLPAAPQPIPPQPKAIAHPSAPTAPRLEQPKEVDDKDAANALFKVLENIITKKEAPPAATTSTSTPASTASTEPSHIVPQPASHTRNGRLSVSGSGIPAAPAPLPEETPVIPAPEPLVTKPSFSPAAAMAPSEEAPLPAEEIRRALPLNPSSMTPEDFTMRSPTERLIQIGDLIDIKMPDEPDLNLQARVTREGRITLPYAGDVVIMGKTLSEATKVIKSRLAGYYVNPVITLNVSEPAKGQFVILGQVERPGVYDIAGNLDTITLTEALAKASGTLRYGDIGKVTVKRTIAGQEQMATFDAKSMTQGAQNFNIMPGDTIIVRLSKNEFSILGEVRMPGLYSIPPMQDSVDLMEAIAMAGGAARFGDFGEIVIKRTKGSNEQILKVDAKALGRNESLQKVPVYAGDTIIVRLLRNEFVILGQVQRPGTYSIPPLQDNVDMLEALALAGGATRLANLNSITVRRTVEDKEIVITVNMNQLIRGDHVEKFPVLPGDRIVVSERMF